MSCTSTDTYVDSLSGVCKFTYRLTGSGTASSTGWRFDMRYEGIEDDPPGCSEQVGECGDYTIDIRQTAPRPSGCDYADAGTVQANLDSGPLVGAREFLTYGTWEEQGGMYRWQVSASLPWTTAQSIEASMQWCTPYLAPSGMPDTLLVQAGDCAGSPPDGTVWMGYGEDAYAYAFQVTSATGSLIVNALGEDPGDNPADGIAGSFDVTFTGTEYVDGVPSPATRRVTADYFVLSDYYTFASDPERSRFPMRTPRVERRTVMETARWHSRP